MKVVQINATCGVGSTGKICVGISELLTQNRIENYIIHSAKSSGYELGIKCADEKYIKIQALKSRILGNYGFNSKKATLKIIEQLENFKPNIVHLHNIHGHDCHLQRLFTYFKDNDIKLVWTFHDCWAFTAYCTHFTTEECDKWITGCEHCAQKCKYSWFFDKSKLLFERKKKLFEGLDLSVVTPSNWLGALVKQSIFKDYNIEVINNGIDLDLFAPVESDLRIKHGLENKKIVLGVSFGWDYEKGLDVFIELASRLPDEYQIVLVGTDDNTDKRLPDNIISIHRTRDAKELASFYTAADVFVNPSRQETYPTVNMEAIACGTPVITFETTGNYEMLDATCGAVVPLGDITALENEIIRICTDKPFSKEACLKKCAEFDKNKKFKEYLELYERVGLTRA